MSGPTWTSTTYPDGNWPPELASLWQRTQRRFEMIDALDPVFGEGSTWYFWDETWADACGPFPSEAEARVAIHNYAKTL